MLKSQTDQQTTDRLKVERYHRVRICDSLTERQRVEIGVSRKER